MKLVFSTQQACKLWIFIIFLLFLCRYLEQRTSFFLPIYVKKVFLWPMHVIIYSATMTNCTWNCVDIDVTQIDLDANKFTGELPVNFTENLIYLSCRKNQIHGGIPAEYIQNANFFKVFYFQILIYECIFKLYRSSHIIWKTYALHRKNRLYFHWIFSQISTIFCKL